LACDLVIAKESASFIQAFSKIGLIPDSGGTFILPRLVGMQKALSLMITGEKVGAKQAENMNMIYKSIEDDLFEEEVSKIAIGLAQMPTKGIGLTKRAINQSWDNTLQDQLDLEELLQTEAGQTADFKEGVTAFLEKRKPIFNGK
jgi:2-(1,2-epoxy-1,2-dihydrophenyl)acetyl-CoA isomerase